MYNSILMTEETYPAEESPSIPKLSLSYLLLTLVLTVFSAAPLAYPGYVQVHSGLVPIYNLTDLASRPLTPGWTPSVATSFDPLRGDGILPYYLALPIVWLGRTPLAGVKAIFMLSFLLGAVGPYLWLYRQLGARGAALAALVYTYLPYRLAAVYVRGAWGEALFLGLLPWALAAATSNRLKAWTRHGLTVLTWALLGLSQAGLAIWAFILLVAWILLARRGRNHKLVDHKAQPYKIRDRKWQPYPPLLAALGGTVMALVITLLAAGFSVPYPTIKFFDHFLFPGQLFSAFWGFGASRPGWADGLALGFGLAAVGLAGLTLILAALQKRQPSDPSSQDRTGPSLPGLFILILGLILPLFGASAFLWRLTFLSHTLTYPWQLLGLIGLLLSALAGYSLMLNKRLGALPVYAGLVIIVLLSSYSYLEPRFTQFPPDKGPRAVAGPQADWDNHRLMLLDHEAWVEIPPAAAGLDQATPGRLPLSDYGHLGPGDTLHLSLTWQATRPFYRDLKLFIHLLDGSGQLITQTDPLAGLGAGPQETDYFTSQWDPGQLILDEVAIAIPPDSPPGPYRLAIGLYDGQTLERLPVVGREDGQIEIELGDRASDSETS